MWERSIYYWKQEKTKGYGVRATTMEDENAVTPTLCFAQVSLDRCSKYAWSDITCYQTSDVRYPFLLNLALLFWIIVNMTIECERDQYIIENKRKPKVTEWGRQRWKMKTLLLQRCASHKFHLIDVPNTRDQILSDQRRSRCEWSNCFLWIPFILISGSSNECRLHTCDVYIIITWTWKLRATLVARNKSG